MRWFLAALPCLLATEANAQVFTGPATAIDGDTLAMTGIRVRLHGIDAPELSQSCSRAEQSWPCGKEAKSFLAALVDQSTVACTQRDKDSYGRIVAVCKVGRRDLGEAMVGAGFALSLSEFGGAYDALEARMRTLKIGVWSGSFQHPADFRAANSTRPPDAPQPPLSSKPPRPPRPSARPPRLSLYFRNCAAARAAGFAPIYRGTPGYRPQLDGENDGIACEPIRR